MTYKELLQCINFHLKSFNCINYIIVEATIGLISLDIEIYEPEYIADKLIGLDITKVLKEMQLQYLPMTLDMEVNIICTNKKRKMKSKDSIIINEINEIEYTN